MKLEEILKQAIDLSDFFENNSRKSNAEISNIIKELLDVSKAVKEAKKDGKFSISEIIKILTEVIDLVTKTELIKKLKSDKKYDIIISILREIYFGEDFFGNPDIPYIPNFIENKLEEMLFDLVLPGVVKAIADKNESN